MGLLYDVVSVTPDAILTVKEFPTPFSGRMVKFDIPGGYHRKEVYVLSDSSLAGPYTRPGQVETDLRGLEIFRRGCFSSTVLVVDLAEQILPPVTLQPTPVPVRLSSGENASVQISGSMEVSVCVRDSRALVADYMEKQIASAERSLSSALLGQFKRMLAMQLRSCFSCADIADALAEVDQMADRIAGSVVDGLEQECPWVRVIGRRCTLTIGNQEELIRKANYRWQKEEERDDRIFDEKMKLHVKTQEANMELQRMTMNAMLQVYGADPIPRPIMEAVVAMVYQDPTIRAPELVDLIRTLRDLSRHAPPDQILSTMKQLMSGSGK